ncbi:putative copper homeostasis (lipo)protein LpqS [Mycobacterium sp. LTG2003]
MTSALRCAVVAAMACLALAIAGEWQAASHEHAVHHPHAVAAAIGDHLAVVVDHPHADDNSGSHAPETFANAVLPRAATALSLLVLVAFGVGCTLLSGCIAVGPSRGPPDRQAPTLTGQARLVRFCISRR